MNRRTFLTGAAGAAVVGLPVVALVPTTDLVPALVAEYFRLFAIHYDTDEEADAHCDLIAAVEDRLCETPATTLAGLRDKMRVLVHQLDGNHVAPDEPIVVSLMADLERLASG